MNYSDYQQACVDAMGFSRKTYEAFMNLEGIIPLSDMEVLLGNSPSVIGEIASLARWLGVNLEVDSDTGEILYNADSADVKGKTPAWPKLPMSQAYSILVDMPEGMSKGECVKLLESKMSLSADVAEDLFDGTAGRYSMVEFDDGLWHGKVRNEHRPIYPKELQYRDGEGVTERIIEVIRLLPYKRYSIEEMKRALYLALPDDSAGAICSGLSRAMITPKWRQLICAERDEDRVVWVGPKSV